MPVSGHRIRPYWHGSSLGTIINGSSEQAQGTLCHVAVMDELRKGDRRNACKCGGSVDASPSRSLLRATTFTIYCPEKQVED